MVSSCGLLRSCDCIILYRPIYNLLNLHSDLEGRFLICSFLFRDFTFNISRLYAPNRNPARNDFFDDVVDAIDLSFPTFICGDFKTIIDRSMDKHGSHTSDYSRESLHALSHFLMHVALQISGAIYIQIAKYLPGPYEMALWLLVLI